tara:strand:- start:1129 stop:1287 length:159 start_codon:yes stop_codon:yes gene_type:complete
MKTTEKLYCPVTNDTFVMQFGFEFPKSTWSMKKRIDTRTKSHGNPRNLNKPN